MLDVYATSLVFTGGAATAGENAVRDAIGAEKYDMIRETSCHGKMAPDTPSVRAELSRRAEALAESKGL